MRLQNKATAEPIRIVVGMIIRWSSDLIIILAMCGTISPIKDMGPQNAVTIAVRSPVMTNKRFLITFTRFNEFMFKNRLNPELSGLIVSFFVVLFVHGVFDHTAFWIQTGVVFLLVINACCMYKKDDLVEV